MRPSHYFELGETQADVVGTCERYWKILDELVKAFDQTQSQAPT